MIPFDQELTKLRIKMESARRNFEAADKAYLRERRDFDAASIAYHQRAKALGYCGTCEKLKAECKCACYASGGAGN